MEKNQITNRILEVQQELEAMATARAALVAELDELTIAKRVVERLSESKPAKPSMAAQLPAGITAPQAYMSGDKTVKQLVIEAIKSAQEAGKEGIAPRDIRKYIKSKYNRDIKGQANVVPSRLWRVTKELEKDTETGLFSLPKNTEPEGDLLSTASPTGSNLKPTEQDREVVSGGGA